MSGPPPPSPLQPIIVWNACIADLGAVVYLNIGPFPDWLAFGVDALVILGVSAIGAFYLGRRSQWIASGQAAKRRK